MVSVERLFIIRVLFWRRGRSQLINVRIVHIHTRLIQMLKGCAFRVIRNIVFCVNRQILIFVLCVCRRFIPKRGYVSKIAKMLIVNNAILMTQQYAQCVIMGINLMNRLQYVFNANYEEFVNNAP